MTPETREFVKRVTGLQNRLYSYIISLVGSAQDAEDVLQDVNVALWEKMEQALAADNFTAWAYGVARTQVLAYHRDHRRDRHVFDPELLELINTEAVEIAEDISGRRDAFERCLGKLDDPSRQLVGLRYEQALPVKQVADRVGKSAPATTQSLYRIRLSLLECIERLERTGEGDR